ncbi:MAG: hypothetical protein ACKO7S_00895 [Actinomycetota bacterium]
MPFPVPLACCLLATLTGWSVWLTLVAVGALFFAEDRTVTFLFEELDFEEGLEGFGE